MSDVTVRALVEDDWATYRQMRLAALKESPDAFVSTSSRKSRASTRTSGGCGCGAAPGCWPSATTQPVGVVSLGDANPVGTTGTASTQGAQRRRRAVRDVGRARRPGAPGWPGSLVDAAAAEARGQGART